jgi:hypothetical protein
MATASRRSPACLDRHSKVSGDVLEIATGAVTLS